MGDSSDIVVDVITALGEAEGTDPAHLEYSLYEYIDPGVLSKLAEMNDGCWTLTFRVEEHEVRLTSDGQLFVDGVQYRDRPSIR